MKNIIERSFGGLSLVYYLRHLFFGFIMLVLIYLTRKDITEIWIMVICFFLYPYSRFVYEKIVDFILGDNRFSFDARIFLITKLITMAFCFVFAFLIAPIGLIFLYFHHGKNK